MRTSFFLAGRFARHRHDFNYLVGVRGLRRQHNIMTDLAPRSSSHFGKIRVGGVSQDFVTNGVCYMVGRSLL